MSTHLFFFEKKRLLIDRLYDAGKGLLTLLLIANLATAQTYTPTTAAGTSVSGTGATQLNAPSGVFIDSHGNLFVADQKNHRIQKFPPSSTSATAGTTVAGVTSTSGSDATHLNAPYGVYVDASDYIYVADFYNHRIQKFPPNSTEGTAGTMVAGTGLTGPGNEIVDLPTAVFVSEPSGEIYVADVSKSRIQKFPANSTAGTAGTTVAGVGVALGAPITLFVDGSSNLFVSEYGNHRIKKFPPNSTSLTSGTIVAGTGTAGAGSTQLQNPFGVFVDGQGNLFVSDAGNNRIQKFPPNSTSLTSGTTVAGTGTSGSGSTQLSAPTGLFIDGRGNIFVADNGNHRIQKWMPALVLQTAASPDPVAAGSTVALSVTATGGGTLPLSYTWTAPAGITLPPSTNTSALSGTVSCSLSGIQTLTVTVAGANDLPISTSLVSFSVTAQQQPPSTVLNLTVDESSCPVRIVGQATGTSFIFTNNSGYVFSNVFRTGGTHNIVADGIKTPGIYTLTAINSNACGVSTPVTQTVTVTRSCP